MGVIRAAGPFESLIFSERVIWSVPWFAPLHVLLWLSQNAVPHVFPFQEGSRLRQPNH